MPHLLLASRGAHFSDANRYVSMDTLEEPASTGIGEYRLVKQYEFIGRNEFDDHF
jgi:hypothetical protein